ncbi:hypothetical protein FACS1894132_05960 [Clostridia bacterium]|nr:hypothetical protein FACS1894132_05960 [Clostridia bacterium]
MTNLGFLEKMILQIIGSNDAKLIDKKSGLRYDEKSELFLSPFIMVELNAFMCQQDAIKSDFEKRASHYKKEISELLYKLKSTPKILQDTLYSLTIKQSQCVNDSVIATFQAEIEKINDSIEADKADSQKKLDYISSEIDKKANTANSNILTAKERSNARISQYQYYVKAKTAKLHKIEFKKIDRLLKKLSVRKRKLNHKKGRYIAKYPYYDKVDSIEYKKILEIETEISELNTKKMYFTAIYSIPDDPVDIENLLKLKEYRLTTITNNPIH